MADLLWPGEHRARDVFCDEAFLAAMLAVEQAWLDALVRAGVAPGVAPDGGGRGPRIEGLVTAEDLPALAVDAESGGNPVIALVALLRGRLGEGSGDDGATVGLERREGLDKLDQRVGLDQRGRWGSWLHRGLTSQDVVDTALVLCARDATTEIAAHLRAQVATLIGLVEQHRDTPMVARTLTQHAVPTTFGLRAAQWLSGVLDAHDGLAALTYPAQLGGAAGTLAAAVELAGPAGATAVVAATADALGLADVPPWHTTRTAVTRIGDAAVTCTDAWGRLANDVLVLGRPEIGELSEGVGGGSSTMPHKANPVLSVLVRRAALTTPQLAATLHLAAAGQVDERADGAWHAEWDTLRTLLRRTLVAAAQTTDLLAGLQVHPDRMAWTLAGAGGDVLAEQRSLVALTGRDPRDTYLGLTHPYLDAALDRARPLLEETP